MNHEQQTRVLGYQLARELSLDEIAQVSGGASHNGPSYSGPAGRARQDDVATDDV